jgi:signal transduction histidine kinase
MNDSISQWQELNEARKLLARYELIIQLSQELSSTLDTTTLLHRIVKAAAEVTDSEAASILLLDPASGELRFEMASNMTSLEFERFVVPVDGSIAGWVVTHGAPRLIDNVNEEPSFFRNVDDTTQFHTRTLLAVPLRSHQGKVIGCLEALNKRAGEHYDQDDVRLLTMFALHAAVAIENARLFLQSDFMSEMVHELRTPLVALKTSVSLLRRAELPQDRRVDIVQTMNGEIERLMRLASEYLDLARLESGRSKMEMADVPLADLVAECVNVVQPQAAERGIEIKFIQQPLVVRADRGKVKQVLLNLLTNAVKYNREAGVIDVSLQHASQPQAAYGQVAVADTGYGISKENQRYMFQKFYRVADTAGFTQGTGLGLAIARHIIEAHGGNIWLESEPGIGSTFFFTLPAVSN